MTEPSMAPYTLDTPDVAAYPCSRPGCNEPSVLLRAVPFNRNGMSSSIAFYGYCKQHEQGVREGG